MAKLTVPGMGGVFNAINLHVYYYAGNNPIKYVDPDGKSLLGWFIPNADKMTKEEARQWIDDYVCGLKGFLICSDMYTKSLNGNSDKYKKGPEDYIAIVMSHDKNNHAYKQIKSQLENGILEGGSIDDMGTTSWSNNDLKFSIGSCGFFWKFINYDNGVAKVQVTIHDTFDFNKGDGKRNNDAEKLTAIGRKAELTPYKVEVIYELQISVKIPEISE